MPCKFCRLPALRSLPTCRGPIYRRRTGHPGGLGLLPGSCRSSSSRLALCFMLSAIPAGIPSAATLTTPASSSSISRAEARLWRQSRRRCPRPGGHAVVPALSSGEGLPHPASASRPAAPRIDTDSSWSSPVLRSIGRLPRYNPALRRSSTATVMASVPSNLSGYRIDLEQRRMVRISTGGPPALAKSNAACGVSAPDPRMENRDYTGLGLNEIGEVLALHALLGEQHHRPRRKQRLSRPGADALGERRSVAQVRSECLPTPSPPAARLIGDPVGAGDVVRHPLE